MLITIKNYTIAMDAYITKGRLEAEGIPTYIADEHFIAAQWTMSVAIGGVKLQVPSTYANKAREIISELEKGEYDVSTNENVDTEVSPNLQTNKSEDTHSVNWPWKLALVLLFLLHLPLPFTRHLYKSSSGSYSIATEERGHPMYVHIFAVIVTAVVIFTIFNVLYYWGCQPYNCRAPF